MGDMFHQSNTQQSSTQQQVGVSTRDVGGNFTTVGAGATVNQSNLDPIALQTAAEAIHDSAAVQIAASQGQTTAYQSALSAQAETTSQALQLASSGAGAGTPLTGATGALGLNPSQVIWIAGGALAVILIIGFMRR